MKTSIFIENNAAALANALNYFCKGERGALALFLVREAQLRQARVAGTRILIERYAPDSLGAMLEKIVDVLVARGVDQIEFHIGVSGSRYLTRALRRIRECKRDAMLHFYDDGYTSVVTRTFLARLPDGRRVDALEAARALIRRAVDARHDRHDSVAAWNTVMDYAWPGICPTRYHLVDASCRMSAEFSWVPLQPLSTTKQKALYAALFGMTPKLCAALGGAEKSNSLLLLTRPFSAITAASYDELFDDLLPRVAIHGWSVSDGHIIRQEMSPSAMTASSMGRTIILPKNTPWLSLRWLDALPSHIAGELTDEMYLLPKEKIRFLTISEMDSQAEHKMRLAIQLQMATAQRIFRLPELAKYHQTGGVVRIFYCSASMGDLIYALGSLRALRESYGEKFVVIAHELYRALAIACPDVDEFWPLEHLSARQRLIVEIARRQKMLHLLEGWPIVLAEKHMTDACLQLFPGSAHGANKTPRISLRGLDMQRVNDFVDRHQLCAKKTVLLHPNRGDPNRTWSESGWRELAGYFVDAGWRVVVIGSNSNKFASKRMMLLDVPGAINAVDEFSTLETIYLMSLSTLLVACDSGPVALAGLTSIAICALYSVVPSAYRLPYRHGRIGWNACGIDVGCKLGQCGPLIKKLRGSFSGFTGEDFRRWCPADRSYRCLSGFSAAEFWKRISLFLASDKFIDRRIGREALASGPHDGEACKAAQ